MAKPQRRLMKEVAANPEGVCRGVYEDILSPTVRSVWGQGWVQLHIVISITITFKFLVQLQLHS